MEVNYILDSYISDYLNNSNISQNSFFEDLYEPEGSDYEIMFRSDDLVITLTINEYQDKAWILFYDIDHLIEYWCSKEIVNNLVKFIEKHNHKLTKETLDKIKTLK